MSGFFEVSASPSRVGNFIISYDNDVDLVADLHTSDITQFFNTAVDQDIRALCDVDSAFVPRALTETSLLEAQTEQQTKKPNQNSVTITEDKELEEKFHSPADNKINAVDMAGKGKNMDNFKPDVVLSNSHQRPGPDGSPALAPTRRPGFMHSNMSDTSELFNPVRTLTFSDVDQSSHMEDSYVNTSRFVSTPTRENGQGAPRQYDYSSMQGSPYQSGSLNVMSRNDRDVNDDSDSSDSNGMINVGCKRTPEFRQLEGEADPEFQSTGPFHPSAHGLSKEFMDQFVGKSNNLGLNEDDMDIFSPLGSNSLKVNERQIQSTTPPLHSPAPDSPLAKFAKGSPRPQRSPYQRGVQQVQQSREKDRDEIQFQMSSTRTQPAQPFHREVIGYGPYLGSSRGMDYEMYHHDLNQHAFKPVDNPALLYEQLGQVRNVPRNLNEYFDHHDSSNQHAGAIISENVPVKEGSFKGQKTQSHPEGSGINKELDMESRQGDGSDTDGDDSRHRFQQVGVNQGQHEAAVLPRMQVSVKLPQATYDTISADTSRDEKFHTEPTNMKSRYDQPDIALSGSVGKSMNREYRTSPEKVMDLLQNQSEHSANQSTDCSESRNQTNLEKKKVEDTRKHDDLGTSQVSNEHQIESQPKAKPRMTKPDEDQNSSTDKNNSVQETSGRGKNTVTSQGNGKPVTSQAVVQISDQSQTTVSSRLLQETVSQRNKATQKYVSNVPVPGKPTSNTQNNGKEFKKPYDVCPRNSVHNAASNGQGVRKNTRTDTNQKFKVSDKVKPKTNSTENLAQRQNYHTTQNRTSAQGQGQLQGQFSRGQSQNGAGTSYEGQGQRFQGHGEGQGHDGSIHSIEDGENQKIVTQVETTSPVPVEVAEHSMDKVQTREASLDIRGMEEVRQQLQNMMKLSHAQMTPQERTQYEHSEIVAGFGVDLADMSWNAGRRGEDGLFNNLSSLTNPYMTDSGNVSRSDTSLLAENQRLRDMLEKERYRRKHCEQYIQQLNIKLLETQQQVAVAVSTDKRKDLMIEQLDKQLGRVMEGWKKRDEEKEEIVAKMRAEKEEIEQKMIQQQKMINNFEHDMSEALDALRKEKETASHKIEELSKKVQKAEHDKEQITHEMEAEVEKGEIIQQECERLREDKETLEKKLDQMQRRIHREEDEWFKREQELVQRIEEVSEKNTKILNNERVKTEEQVKLAEEIMEQYQIATNELKKAELDLDAAEREKESLKVEMGIMEAKFENTQRVLEADLHNAMEKQITEQIADVQRRHEVAIGELQERHREQMLELTEKNGQETERQLANFHKDMARKEEEFRKHAHELEMRMTEYRNENAELKRTKQKLESNRLEILTKLQYAMQSQWNEAVSLLAATPQRNFSLSRTSTSQNDTAVSCAQSMMSVNFSLYGPQESSSTNQNTLTQPPSNQNTPPRPKPTNHSHSLGLASQMDSASFLTNQSTPPRQTRSTNHDSPSRISTSEISPVQRQPMGHEHLFSPGRESMVSHSTEKDHDDVAIENAAMNHLKQFQEYINNFTKTPDWISTINSQPPDSTTGGSNQSADIVLPSSSPRLPSPPEIAALLQTHLHNIQQQQFMPRPQPTNQSESLSQPTSLSINHRQFDISQQSASSLPTNINSELQHIQNVQSVNQPTAPPTAFKPTNQNGPYLSASSNYPMNTSDRSESTNPKSAYSDMRLWEGAGAQAVPMKPPQQCDDPYMNNDASIVSAVSVGPMRGYFQGGQSFSPPTKENLDSDNNSTEDISHQANRLNDDYCHITEKFEKHENQQNDLQHYIQMLLHRSPSDGNQGTGNHSMYSQDNEEFDMNDSTQAAQLQSELDRLQQLRTRQELANQNRSMTEANKHNTKSTHEGATNKILNDDQLAEVSRLLNEVKGQGQSQGASGVNSSAVNELLDLLKHAQGEKGGLQSDGRKGQEKGPGSERKKGPGAAVGRRNVQFKPSKGQESNKQASEAGKGDRSATKPAQTGSNKKPERKVAGPTMKGEKGPKPAAWK